MNRRAIVAASLSILLFTPATPAAPITTLFSTGVSPAGLALGDFAADPHYVLTASPGGFYPVASAVTVASASLPPGWTANSATSRWINPTGLAALPADWHPGGTYVYTTTFSLAGYVPSTTTIYLGCRRQRRRRFDPAVRFYCRQRFSCGGQRHGNFPRLVR